LRNDLTPAEATLWKALKGSALKNRKFRRQHSIENYIVDLYCPQERLIIELDGAVHKDPVVAHNDHIRSLRLQELGNKIIRFENSLVFTQLDNVLHAIASHFKSE